MQEDSQIYSTFIKIYKTSFEEMSSWDHMTISYWLTLDNMAGPLIRKCIKCQNTNLIWLPDWIPISEEYTDFNSNHDHDYQSCSSDHAPGWYFNKDFPNRTIWMMTSRTVSLSGLIRYWRQNTKLNCFLKPKRLLWTKFSPKLCRTSPLSVEM